MTTWLPAHFQHPLHVDLPTGHHLRPIRAADVDLDMVAVMGSRDRLWAIYGDAWGWPPATMTHEQDRDDLAHHEREIEAHESFNYAVFDRAEERLLGCIYIDPPQAGADHDAVISWWVVDSEVGAPVEEALDDFVPAWIAQTWGFARPYFGVL
jgi:RimJ/RimL family protein N-acetyltransferase